MSSTSSTSIPSGISPSTSSDSDIPTAAAPSSAIPSYVDNGPHPDAHPPSNSSLLNYYFLLLAVFIFIFVIVYYILVRRRKQKIAHLRFTGQNALAQDLEGWPGTRRWMGGSRGARPREHRREEDGLNEQGEAPPPYMPKEPDGALVRAESSGGGIMLREMGGEDRKPPDYVGR